MRRARGQLTVPSTFALLVVLAACGRQADAVPVARRRQSRPRPGRAQARPPAQAQPPAPAPAAADRPRRRAPRRPSPKPPRHGAAPRPRRRRPPRERGHASASELALANLAPAGAWTRRLAGRGVRQSGRGGAGGAVDAVGRRAAADVHASRQHRSAGRFRGVGARAGPTGDVLGRVPGRGRPRQPPPAWFRAAFRPGRCAPPGSVGTLNLALVVSSATWLSSKRRTCGRPT